MLQLAAVKREAKKPSALRKEGVIPAVLYGPGVETTPVSLASREFEAVYQEAGESSLVLLEQEGEQRPVLVHEVQRDPLSGAVLHVDLYQPALDKEIDVTVPLRFEGEAPAVRDFGGTLVKNLHEVEVRALPQNLPHEIPVNVEGLASFEDQITVQDLQLPQGVQVAADPEELVVQVMPPENVEEELAQPVEEKVEEVGAAAEKGKQEEKEAESSGETA